MNFEEFISEIKKIFIKSLNGLSEANIEQQTYNKAVVSIIERNIISPIYEEENYAELEDSDNEKDYEKITTSMIGARDLATQQLIMKLCNPENFTVCNSSEFNSYDMFLKTLISEPYVSHSEVFINGKRLFDYETAKKLYKEILVPYYKMLGFPTRTDENNIEEPYNFSILDFNTNRISEDESAKLKKHYLEKGYMQSTIDELIMHPESGLAPSEVMLLHQYKEEVSKGHLKK